MTRFNFDSYDDADLDREIESQRDAAAAITQARDSLRDALATFEQWDGPYEDRASLGYPASWGSLEEVHAEAQRWAYEHAQRNVALLQERERRRAVAAVRHARQQHPATRPLVTPMRGSGGLGMAYVARVWTEQTGGGVMVDFVELASGVTVTISDDAIVIRRRAADFWTEDGDDTAIAIVELPRKDA